MRPVPGDLAIAVAVLVDQGGDVHGMAGQVAAALGPAGPDGDVVGLLFGGPQALHDREGWCLRCAGAAPHHAHQIGVNPGEPLLVAPMAGVYTGPARVDAPSEVEPCSTPFANAMIWSPLRTKAICAHSFSGSAVAAVNPRYTPDDR